MMRQTEVRFGKDHTSKLDEFLGRSYWDYNIHIGSGIIQPFYEAKMREGSPEVLVLMRMSEYANKNSVYLFENSQEWREFQKSFHRLDPETGKRS